MTYESIQFQIENGIAVLTLNRPDRLNSFTQAMHREVRDALDTLQADKTVRVLVLTGAGRGFCAGQDLNDRAVKPSAAARTGRASTSASRSKNSMPRW
jgi:2-(1,2-epoxy-1,2-dihydrophenyl)acetyl-CoA isomerase